MPEQPWWYLKKRRNPSGVIGRPRSRVPLAERRKLARQKYQAKLASRGLRLVRLLLSTAAVDKLRAKSAVRQTTWGELVTDLLENGH
jgi:hypothetical protein